MRWQDMPEGKEKYAAYLCSREWSLLKEAVKERCGGTCERCLVNAMDHVHHLTYARKYRERLDDLQACCKGCHDFIHAKSSSDPAMHRPAVIPWCGTRVKTFYLAGKITGTDWRDAIVPDWSQENHSRAYSDAFGGYDTSKSWDIVENACVMAGVFLHYSGPWWKDVFCHGSSCESRSPHGYSHEHHEIQFENGGYTEWRDACRHEVSCAVMDAIARSDLLFAWIDSSDCYGTIMEIGLAKAMRKAVVVAMSDQFSATAEAEEMWLCNAGSYSVTDKTPADAWRQFWDIVVFHGCRDVTQIR